MFSTLKNAIYHVNSQVTEIKKIDPLFFFKDIPGFDAAPHMPPLEPEEAEKRVDEAIARFYKTRNALRELNHVREHDRVKFQRYTFDMYDHFMEIVDCLKEVEQNIIPLGFVPMAKKWPSVVPSDREFSSGNGSSESEPNDKTPKLKLHGSDCDITIDWWSKDEPKKEELKTPKLSLDILKEENWPVDKSNKLITPEAFKYNLENKEENLPVAKPNQLPTPKLKKLPLPALRNRFENKDSSDSSELGKVVPKKRKPKKKMARKIDFENE